MLETTQDIWTGLLVEAEMSKGVPPLPPLLPTLSCAAVAEPFALEDVEVLAACTVLDPRPVKRDCVNVAPEFSVGSAA